MERFLQCPTEKLQSSEVASPPPKKKKLSLKRKPVVAQHDNVQDQNSKSSTVGNKKSAAAAAGTPQDRPCGVFSRPKRDIMAMFSTPGKAENGTARAAVTTPDAAPFAGLINLGNTCYMNAVLQALRGCNGFRKAISSMAHLGPESVVDGEGDNSLAVKIGELYDEMLKAEQECVCGGSEIATKPDDFYSALTRANLMFGGGQQHDAQEMLRFLLSNLDEAAAKSAAHGRPSVAGDGSAVGVKTVLQRLFEGELVYVTRCTTCETTTERECRFRSLYFNLCRSSRMSMVAF